MADRRKFNLEMGSYLKGRRRSEIIDEEATRYKPRQTYTDEDGYETVEGEEVRVEYERPGFLRRMFAFKRRQAIEEVSEDLSPEELEKLENMEAKIEGIEEGMSEMESMEEELEHERESLLARFMQTLGLRPRYEDIDAYDVEEFAAEEARSAVDRDVKEVLRITHTWLEKLTARQKTAFKESEDFALYKEILGKYGLIKVKHSEAAPEPEPVKEEPEEAPEEAEEEAEAEEKSEKKPKKKPKKK